MLTRSFGLRLKPRIQRYINYQENIRKNISKKKSISSFLRKKSSIKNSGIDISKSLMNKWKSCPDVDVSFCNLNSKNNHTTIKKQKTIKNQRITMLSKNQNKILNNNYLLDMLESKHMTKNIMKLSNVYKINLSKENLQKIRYMDIKKFNILLQLFAGDRRNGELLEYVVTDIFKQKGFHAFKAGKPVDVVIMSKTNKENSDKPVIELAIECKNYRDSVSNIAVDKLRSNAIDIGAKHGAVITTSTFMPGAYRSAEASTKLGLPIHLCDINWLIDNM